MIVDYTLEEQKKRDEILYDYRDMVRSSNRNPVDLLEGFVNKKIAFAFECQKNRVDKLEKDDDTFIKNAEEQIHFALSHIKGIYLSKDKQLQKEFARDGLGIIKGRSFLIDGFMVAKTLDEQLFYHYKYKEHLKKQFFYLILQTIRQDDEIDHFTIENITIDNFNDNFFASKMLDPTKKEKVIKAQNDGRERRRQQRAKAEEQGAIMEIKNGIYPVFSSDELWDAFSPSKISRLGKLSLDDIDERTGRINKINLEKGDVVSVKAEEVSLKAYVVLMAILSNSVDDVREYFVSDQAIKFYVKGVLDALNVDPRIRDDQQLDFSRKTAGVLYLEKAFEPLLPFVGKIPDGSRYAVFNYVGYDVNSDTMEIRSPYLSQLWKLTQQDYFERKDAKDKKYIEGKRARKKDLVPLEVNFLFKNSVGKEDDAVLEIAFFITNTLLLAGRARTPKTTYINYKTIINKCSRLREKLAEIEKQPKIIKNEDGQTQVKNITARYNTELRKIARACSLIMNTDKCDVLKYYEILEFEPTTITKNGEKTFKAPTKKTLNDKITIKWKTIKERN